MDLLQDMGLAQRPTRGDATRRRIVDAAISEFKAAGVDGASISKIAREAGVSRPSFYFHFSSKEQLLLELQRRLEQPIALLIADCDSLGATLDVFVRGLMKARHSVGSRQLFADMLLIYSKNSRELPLDDQPLMFALAEKFTAASQSGELRRGLEPAQATLLYLTSIYGYLIGQSNRVTERECLRNLQQISSLFTA